LLNNPLKTIEEVIAMKYISSFLSQVILSSTILAANIQPVVAYSTSENLSTSTNLSTSRNPSNIALSLTRYERIQLDLFQAISEMDWDKAKSLGEKSVEAAKDEKERVEAIDLVNTIDAYRFIQAYSIGNSKQARLQGVEVVARFAMSRDVDGASTILYLLSAVYVKTDKLDAWNKLKSTISQIESLSQQERRLLALVFDWTWANAQGDAKKIIGLTPELVELSKSMRREKLIPTYLVYLADAHGRMADYRRAAATLERARTEFRSFELKSTTSGLDLNKSHTSRDNPPDRLRGDNPLDFSSVISIVENEGVIDALMGGLLVKQDRFDEALNFYKASLSKEKKQKGRFLIPFHSAMTNVAIAQIFSKRKQYTVADQYLDMARADIKLEGDIRSKLSGEAVIAQNTGLNSYLAKDLKGAESAYSLAVQKINAARTSVSPFLNEESQLFDMPSDSILHQDSHLQNANIAEQFQQVLIDNGDLHQALVSSEMSRSRNFTDLLVNRMTDKSPKKFKKSSTFGAKFLGVLGGVLGVLGETSIGKNNGGTELWRIGSDAAKAGSLGLRLVSIVKNIKSNFNLTIRVLYNEFQHVTKAVKPLLCMSFQGCLP
jgi:tetratricopeptide (TPR) repeat protein